ncbi:hypothetical protein WAI453_012038 [Rhynchosporium graminicola]
MKISVSVLRLLVHLGVTRGVHHPAPLRKGCPVDSMQLLALSNTRGVPPITSASSQSFFNQQPRFFMFGGLYGVTTTFKKFHLKLRFAVAVAVVTESERGPEIRLTRHRLRKFVLHRHCHENSHQQLPYQHFPAREPSTGQTALLLLFLSRILQRSFIPYPAHHLSPLSLLPALPAASSQPVYLHCTACNFCTVCARDTVEATPSSSSRTQAKPRNASVAKIKKVKLFASRARSRNKQTTEESTPFQFQHSDVSSRDFDVTLTSALRLTQQSLSHIGRTDGSTNNYRDLQKALERYILSAAYLVEVALHPVCINSSTADSERQLWNIYLHYSSSEDQVSKQSSYFPEPGQARNPPFTSLCHVPSFLPYLDKGTRFSKPDASYAATPLLFLVANRRTVPTTINLVLRVTFSSRNFLCTPVSPAPVQLQQRGQQNFPRLRARIITISISVAAIESVATTTRSRRCDSNTTRSSNFHYPDSNYRVSYFLPHPCLHSRRTFSAALLQVPKIIFQGLPEIRRISHTHFATLNSDSYRALARLSSRRLKFLLWSRSLRTISSDTRCCSASLRISFPNSSSRTAVTKAINHLH